MEIELIEHPVFDLKIGDTILKGFTVASEWEGFKKLSSAKYGVAIISMNHKGDFSVMFDEILDLSSPTKAILIKGSPDILVAVEAARVKGGAS